MKRLKLLGILILSAIIALMFAGCTDKNKTVFYTIQQDGNFLVFADGSLYTFPTIAKGTKISVKVDETKIPENSRINYIVINNVTYQPDYQYDLVVDQDIDLKVRFERLPVGQVRISLTGDQVKLEPQSKDNVYEEGEEITVHAPRYYKFNTLIVNDQEVFVDSHEYKVKAAKGLTIKSLRKGLVKTHEKLNLVAPRHIDLEVTPKADENGYYELGTKVTITPPKHDIFNGEIEVDGEKIEVLHKEKIEYIIKEKANLVFNDSNIIKEDLEITLGEGLEVIEGNPKDLYEFDSTITLRAIDESGFQIIDKLKVNGKEIEVNALTYELKVDSASTISATFKKYEGKVNEISLKTSEVLPIGKYSAIYSKDLFTNCFASGENIIFSKEGTYEIRVDLGSESTFYQVAVELDLVEIKLKERTHSDFIKKDNLLFIGNKNSFKLDLVKRYQFVDIINIENRLINEEEIKDIENLEVKLFEKGIDVTKLYLEKTRDGKEINFNKDSLDKRFELRIVYKGQSLSKLISVVDAYNVYEGSKRIVEGSISNYAFQSDIILKEPLSVTTDNVIYGNYHSLIFEDIKEGFLINVKDSSYYVSNLRIDANDGSIFNVESAKLFEFDNVTLTNAKIGICVTNSNLKLNQALFRNIDTHNIISVNKDISDDGHPYQVVISNSSIYETNGAAILVVDLNSDQRAEGLTEIDPGYYVDQDIKISFTGISNSKVLSELELSEKEVILNDEVLTIDEVEYVNYLIKLDGGTYYNELLGLGEIVNENPQVNLIK